MIARDRRKPFQGLIALASLAALAAVGAMAVGADQPAQPMPAQAPVARPGAAVAVGPGPKMVIERPTKEVLKARSALVVAAPAARPVLDRPKTMGIERPTVRVVKDLSAPANAAPAAGFVNPKVEPGKVRWHAAFADASTASARSGKPVLLFQMMGKLDDQFC